MLQELRNRSLGFGLVRKEPLTQCGSLYYAQGAW